jgi:hypothetical protein
MFNRPNMCRRHFGGAQPLRWDPALEATAKVGLEPTVKWFPQLVRLYSPHLAYRGDNVLNSCCHNARYGFATLSGDSTHEIHRVADQHGSRTTPLPRCRRTRGSWFRATSVPRHTLAVIPPTRSMCSFGEPAQPPLSRPPMLAWLPASHSSQAARPTGSRPAHSPRTVVC